MRYPNGIEKEITKNITYNNRGMTLEQDINITNQYYLDYNIACIHKKPTPINIVKVEGNKIKEAFFKTSSTTDYNGIYKGKYIDFDAKETNLDYFPIDNLQTHQLKHLKTVLDMGGISFIIVRFNKYNKVYLLETKKILFFIDSNKKKSLPLSFFEENGYEILFKFSPRLDYIKALDIILEGEKNEQTN
ncbi:MAG: Holliday junction resolvase RecU [Bacilli bacterium]